MSPTYKLVPGATPVPITAYGKDHAHAVVTAAMQDYHEVYGLSLIHFSEPTRPY